MIKRELLQQDLENARKALVLAEYNLAKARRAFAAEDWRECNNGR